MGKKKAMVNKKPMRERLQEALLDVKWLTHQKEMLKRHIAGKNKVIHNKDVAMSQQFYIIYRLLLKMGGNCCIEAPVLDADVSGLLESTVEFDEAGKLKALKLRIKGMGENGKTN